MALRLRNLPHRDGGNRCDSLFSLQKNPVALAGAHARRIGILLAPLIDVLAFSGFMTSGESLRASNSYAFAIGYLLSVLLRWRELSTFAQPPSQPRLLTRCVIVGFMAVFLRAGVLALLVQRWGWTPQAAILVAAAAGLTVTAPRWRDLSVGIIAY